MRHHHRLLSILLLLVIGILPGRALPSSDAGIDLSKGNINLRIIYSVALDYEGREACIRKPECLLYESIALLQERDTKSAHEVVIQFELYQSSNKEGNWLSMVRNPYVDPQPYANLYDGMAEEELSTQIISLLEQEFSLKLHKRSRDTIKLFKCTDKRRCEEIKFGSFPSGNENTGYCLSPGNGCSQTPIIVTRRKMRRYFRDLPE